MQLIYCFGKIPGVLRMIYEPAVVLKRMFHIGGPEKGPFEGRCSKSTAAAAWALMTVGGAWLAAEVVLPAGWLEENGNSR